MSIGETIKEQLQLRNRTQAQLARYLSKCTGGNVSLNTVNRWIPNEKNPNKKVYPPSWKFIPLIAHFLAIPIEELAEISDDDVIEAYGKIYGKRYKTR